MKISTGTCVHCGKRFRYIQVTKPRTLCGGRCEYLRERQLQNERRRALRAVSRFGTVEEVQHEHL